jgi:hypothetical protein
VILAQLQMWLIYGDEYCCSKRGFVALNDVIYGDEYCCSNRNTNLHSSSYGRVHLRQP